MCLVDNYVNMMWRGYEEEFGWVGVGVGGGGVCVAQILIGNKLA